MGPTEYAQLAAFEETYWWHVGRRSIVSRQLKQLNKDRHQLEILNVGGGTGGTVDILSEHGNVLNIDQSEEAVSRLRSNGFRAFRIDGRSTPFQNEQFDLVAGLDVLEHIKQDLLALHEWRRVLKPGGYLLLTVPAYQWLWSGHDASLGHQRRYTVRHLRRLVQSAGFEVCNCTYAITFSFPLIVFFRVYQKLFQPGVKTSSYVQLPRWINSLLIDVLRIEGLLLERVKFPFGTSVLLIARTPAIAKKRMFSLSAGQDVVTDSLDVETVPATLP